MATRKKGTRKKKSGGSPFGIKVPKPKIIRRRKK